MVVVLSVVISSCSNRPDSTTPLSSGSSLFALSFCFAEERPNRWVPNSRNGGTKRFAAPLWPTVEMQASFSSASSSQRSSTSERPCALLLFLLMPFEVFPPGFCCPELTPGMYFSMVSPPLLLPRSAESGGRWAWPRVLRAGDGIVERGDDWAGQVVIVGMIVRVRSTSVERRRT